MASLSPPLNRHRASSTSLRPPLTLHSCGRRRSNSDLPAPALSPIPPTPLPDSRRSSMDDQQSLPIPPAAHSYLAKATFAEFYSRLVHLLHIKHAESTSSLSEPSSPGQSRSSLSDDDCILPISSPTVTTFGDIFSEKPTVKSTSWSQGSPSVSSDAPTLSDDFSHQKLTLF
jgi:hypothetical protein